MSDHRQLLDKLEGYREINHTLEQMQETAEIRQLRIKARAAIQYVCSNEPEYGKLMIIMQELRDAMAKLTH